MPWLMIAALVLAGYSVYDMWRQWFRSTWKGRVGRVLTLIACVLFSLLIFDWKEGLVVGFATSVVAVKAGPTLLRGLVDKYIKRDTDVDMDQEPSNGP